MMRQSAEGAAAFQAGAEQGAFRLLGR